MALGRPEMDSRNASSEATKTPKRSLTHSVGAKDPPTPAKIDGERAGCSGLQVPRGSPGHPSSTFSTPAPFPLTSFSYLVNYYL